MLSANRKVLPLLQDNILHLINGQKILGAERVAAEICLGLSAMGLNPHIGLMNGSLEMENEFREQYPCNAFSVHNFKCRTLLGTIYQLYQFCLKERISIIHSHGYKSDIFACFLSFLLPGLQLIATNHNHIVNSKKENFYRWLDLKVLSRFSKVIAVSKQVQEEMYENGLSLRQDVAVIHNGIDLNLPFQDYRKQVREELSISEPVLALGIVASLTVEKDHKSLFLSLSKLLVDIPHIKLIVVGEGGVREDLEGYAKELNIEKSIVFLGHRPDVQKLLSGLDVFVLPSLREGLPMALLEAMSAGLPVVTSHVGAIPQVIEDGCNGYMISPGQHDQLTERLMSLLSSSCLRKGMGKEARKTVTQHFSRERMVKSYTDVYTNIQSSERLQ